ncbi:MAG: hypothetical protein IID51_14190 [Proteobacteria bacterium]|nr:hypothetical protein [Pseudomonadota bacterium]
MSSIQPDEELKRRKLQEQDLALQYNPAFREWGVRVLDGGSSVIVIDYCPWTGAKLPKPLRDEWFELVEELGLDPHGSDVPEEMGSDEWWIARGL